MYLPVVSTSLPITTRQTYFLTSDHNIKMSNFNMVTNWYDQRSEIFSLIIQELTSFILCVMYGNGASWWATQNGIQCQNFIERKMYRFIYAVNM
jgi:hypothetical protein